MNETPEELDPTRLDEDLRASILADNIRPDGTRYGSQNGHRAMAPIRPARSRRRCSCGCGTRATHTGLGDGLPLLSGCAQSINLWVLDPAAALAQIKARA